jgi:transcriptional regulator with XRE-family HTH domain
VPNEAAVVPSALAHRLRDLREHRWPGIVVRQRTLAEALGVSVPLISSWENEVRLTPPRETHLHDYATFFATKHSVANGHGRLMPDSKLSAAEVVARDDLRDELMALRRAVTQRAMSAPPLGFDWKYPKGAAIRIVCGSLDLSEGFHKYMDPQNPNYTELLRYADADALIELFGHLRMVNPDADVRFFTTDQLEADPQSADVLQSHVIVLGGIGLNTFADYSKLPLPIRQIKANRLRYGEIFEVTEPGKEARHAPVMTKGGTRGVEEDVGFLARMRNPNHLSTTWTICNGVYARGVLGAVRTLTDDNLRVQNERYLSAKFAGAASFAILMRVPVLLGAAQTPDLRIARTRLYEWSDAAAP